MREHLGFLKVSSAVVKVAAWIFLFLGIVGGASLVFIFIFLGVGLPLNGFTPFITIRIGYLPVTISRQKQKNY